MDDSAASAWPRRLWQSMAAIALIGYAIAALLSGTDRQSREFPSSPSVVGWPYDTGAARSRAIAAFVQVGPKSALAFASRAILSDPISAQTVSVLGRAQLYARLPLDARKTFEVTGQLGWRDSMTQIYWLDQAMQAGDIKVAAERLDAVLRQDPQEENRDRFLAVVSATPEGRAALAERLKAQPTWTDAYVNDVKDLPADQLAQRVDVVLRAGRGVWNCPSAANFTQRLIDANMLQQAQAVWHGNCGTSNSLVYDGGFDQLDTTRATPGFDWQLSGRGDVDVRPTSDSSGNRRLDIEVSAAQTLPVLSQLIVLTPGSYRLTWRTPDTDPRAAQALSVTLACSWDFAGAEQGKRDGVAKDRYVQVLTVDNACPAHRLTIWVAPRSQIHLDDVVLQPM